MKTCSPILLVTLFPLPFLTHAGTQPPDPEMFLLSEPFANVIHYDGNTPPDSPSNGANWTTIASKEFPGTGWGSSNGELTIATAYERGIWFGWADYVSDTPSWSISPNAVGNHVSMRAKLLPNSGEWSMYVGDSDGYFTSLSLKDSNTILWEYSDAAGPQESTISLNTTDFHTYELLMRQGMVTLIVDDLVRGQAFATSSPDNKTILLFGDGSGGTPTGYGSMVIDYAQIDLAPTIIPEPSSIAAFLGTTTLAVGLYRRRNAKGTGRQV